MIATIAAGLIAGGALAQGGKPLKLVVLLGGRTADVLLRVIVDKLRTQYPAAW